MKINKTLEFSARLVLSTLLLGYLINKISLIAVVNAMKATNLVYVPIILFFFFTSFVIKAWNYRLLTKPIANIPFLPLFKTSIFSWATGMFAPGKIGEFSAIYFLKKQGVPLGPATAISILDKLITTSLLSAVAVVALFFNLKKSQLALEILVIAAGSIVVIVLTLLNHTLRGFARKHILRKYETNFVGFSKFLLNYGKNNLHLMIFNYGLAFVWLIVSTVIVWLGLASVGVYTSLVTLFFINTVSIIVSIIPITLGGLGVRELTAVALFQQAGWPAAEVLGGYLVVTVISNLLALLVSIYAIIAKKY